MDENAEICGLWSVVACEENGASYSENDVRTMAHLLLMSEKIDGFDGIWGSLKLQSSLSADDIQRFKEVLSKLVEAYDYSSPDSASYYGAGGFRLGAQNGESTIDIIQHYGKHSVQGTLRKAIYKITNEQLICCFSPVGSPVRPLSFDSNNNQLTIAFARENPS